MAAAIEDRPGTLVPDGIAPLGLRGPIQHYACITCRSSFPVIDGAIRCNGHDISVCPWCREDSRAWTAGRGM